MSSFPVGSPHERGRSSPEMAGGSSPRTEFCGGCRGRDVRAPRVPSRSALGAPCGAPARVDAPAPRRPALEGSPRGGFGFSSRMLRRCSCSSPFTQKVIGTPARNGARTWVRRGADRRLARGQAHALPLPRGRGRIEGAEGPYLGRRAGARWLSRSSALVRETWISRTFPPPMVPGRREGQRRSPATRLRSHRSARRSPTKSFAGRTFVVIPGVFAPRSVTYGVVREARARLSDISSPVVAEVGTGTGAVAVTLSIEIPAARVIAMDVSARAVRCARKNARRLGDRTSSSDRVTCWSDCLTTWLDRWTRSSRTSLM